MLRFGKTEAAKEGLYGAKNQNKIGMLMLIIYLYQN